VGPGRMSDRLLDGAGVVGGVGGILAEVRWRALAEMHLVSSRDSLPPSLKLRSHVSRWGVRHRGPYDAISFNKRGPAVYGMMPDIAGNACLPLLLGRGR